MEYPFVDLALARRLERAEGAATAALVDARAQLEPGLGATWIEVDGTMAMFDGPDSPMTQTFGFGVFSPPTDAQLDTLEAFFRSRGAGVVHEVSPLAAPTHLELLHRRGYAPIELTTQLFRPTSPAPAPELTVRSITPDESGRWADTSAAGWATAMPDSEALCRSIAWLSVHARGTVSFVAEQDGVWLGTAAARRVDDVCLLSGASTVPAARRRGVQRALLAARLQWARAAGVPLAVMGAAPGSESQRNAERSGFRVAGTRIQWRLRD